ncbi:hypothetical protein AHAS_Ahas15G0240900 [Arachis hypogaea]
MVTIGAGSADVKLLSSPSPSSVRSGRGLSRGVTQAIDVVFEASSTHSKADSMKTKVAQLKKDKEGLLADAKEAISATKEALKAQFQVLAPDVDALVMGAFRTMKDG